MPDVCQQFHQWMRRIDQGAITCTLLIVFCLTCVQLIYSVFCAPLPPYLLSLPPHMCVLGCRLPQCVPACVWPRHRHGTFREIGNDYIASPCKHEHPRDGHRPGGGENDIAHDDRDVCFHCPEKRVPYCLRACLPTPILPLSEKLERLSWLWLLHLGARPDVCYTCRTSHFPHMYDAKDDAHPEDDAWHVAFASHSKQSKVGVKCIASVIFVQAEVFFHIRTILYLYVVVSFPYCLLVWDSFNYYLP